jgi:hypothetical protein
MHYFKVNKYLFWQEKFEDTKGQKKKDKQRSIKYYTEN